MAAIFGADVSVRGPATAQVFVTGQVAANAGEQVDAALHRQLAQLSGLGWKTTVAGANFLTSLELTSRDAHIRAVRNIGASRDADVVLGAYIYVFQERRGSDYGVENPARVTFELVLIEVNTGRLLWHRKYAEQQKSLSDNLMTIGRFFKRKGRWVSALEMAELAIEEMLPDMITALPF